MKRLTTSTRKARFSCSVSVTLAIVLFFTFSIHVSAHAHEYMLIEAISGATEQGPNWHYLVSRGGEEWQELYHTPDWGDNWQYSRNPQADNIYHSIGFGDGIAYAWTGWADGDRFDIAARFTVPTTGTWTIAPWRHLFVEYGYIQWHGEFDGVNIGWFVENLNTGTIDAIIRLNDEEIYRGTSSNTGIVANEPITIEANAGDHIWFIVEPHENANGPVFLNDVGLAPGNEPPETSVMTLELPQDFGGDGVFSLRDMYMGATEHGPVWYYLSREGDGDWQEMTFWDEWGGNNWQYTDNPHYSQIWFSMFDWNGVAAATGFDILDRFPVEMAAGFRAPQSGNLRIGPWRHINFAHTDWEGTTMVFEPNDSSNPSAVEIRHNDTTIYFQRLSGGFQVSPEISVEVQEGDMIYFIVRPMELESVEAGETRVRMDDILLTFDPSVDFANHIARMPEIHIEDRPVPPSQPGDPTPGQTEEQEPEPTEPATTAPPATTPAPTQPPAEESGGLPVIVFIAGGVVIVAVVLVVVLRKKKQ